MVSQGLVFDQIITGMSIGGRLFLIAVGLSLIFGVLDVLNFAHGALFMIGAYIGVVAIQSVAGGFWLGLVAAAAGAGLVGVLIEVGAIRRVYDREELDQLLVTFAFVLILTDVVRFVFGTGQKIVDPPALLRGTLTLTSSLSLPMYRGFIILVSIVTLAVIFFVLRTTNIGRLVRATSSDRDMAALMGVNVPRLYTLVFFVGAALAGLGGALAAPTLSITSSLGDQVIIRAFVIAVIGGLGSFGGAFIGAYFVGLTIALGSIFVPGAGELIPFIAMIAVLLVKPEGLFGGANA